MNLLYVHAPNIHVGGGKVLLCEVLSSLDSERKCVLILDKRLNIIIPNQSSIKTKYITPSFIGRLWAEVWLLLHVGAEDSVLCFGNLPPLFRLRGDAVVYLQNRYLVDLASPLDALPFKLQIRIWMERTWLWWCRFNARRYIVQTPSMLRLTMARLKRPVMCVPFVPENMQCPGDKVVKSKKKYDFIYIASGEAHKNHKALIRAWGILADEGLFPSLALTLSPAMAPELCALASKELALRGARIQIIGVVPYQRVISIYRESGALIYPSGFESFGLPLVEARQAGLAVLAPELDYVRDVIEPDETFDPRSPISIARAVRRHLEGKKPDLELFTARQLLQVVHPGSNS